MNIPIQTEGMSDLDYEHLLADRAEQDLLKRMIDRGIQPAATKVQTVPVQLSPTAVTTQYQLTTQPSHVHYDVAQLQANNDMLHQRAVEKYMANPHYCRVCGNIVPYERRRYYVCSEKCSKHKMSDEERKQKDRKKFQTYINKPGAKEHKAEYMKRYRATHKEQKRIHDRTYYQKHRDHVLEVNKAWNEAHKEDVAAYQKQYREDHKEEIAEQKAQHYAEVKLGTAICSRCKKEYLVTNKNTTLCQDCLQEAYGMAKNDSTYEGSDRLEHRRILRRSGRLTADLDHPGTVTHHANGIKNNNTNDNLIVISRGDHTRIHNLYRTELKRCMEKDVPPRSLDEFTRDTIKELNINTN